MNEIWEQALTIIRREIDPSSYEKWFTPEYIKRIEVRGRFYYICVTDYITKHALEANYLDYIEDVLRTVTADHELCVKVVDLATETIPTPEQQAAAPIPIEPRVPNFNPRYNFSNFVVGDSNRFAHAAAMAVAESLSRTYNPLFIYGESGLGKTHLMHAIGQTVLQRNPSSRVVYVSSEVFTTDFVSMVQRGQMEGFKQRYRSADLLLIDDIQFLSGKSGTQTEFFHTFNELHDAGKQIVISSDRPPRELKPLEDRLRSRFEWGLITDIQPPDLETRCAILQQKAVTDHIAMENSVPFFIAEHIQGNIRELEGALNKIIYYCKLNGFDYINMDIATKALGDLLRDTSPVNLTISAVQKTVAEYYHITVDDLKGQKKDRSIAFPRQIAMYLCRELIGATQPQIGRDFGGRDHTTVIYACNKISDTRKKDTQMDRAIRDIEKILKSPR